MAACKSGRVRTRDMAEALIASSVTTFFPEYTQSQPRIYSINMQRHPTTQLAGMALADDGITGVAITYNGDIYGWVRGVVSTIRGIPCESRLLRHTRTLAHALTRSRTHSLTHLLTRSRTHALTHSLAHSYQQQLPTNKQNSYNAPGITRRPTISPTASPSSTPTASPSAGPTTLSPTAAPSTRPTLEPTPITGSPTLAPTAFPGKARRRRVEKE